MDFIIRQFQCFFESGYVKTSTLKALDEKLDTLKISTSLEMNLRRFKRKKSKSTSSANPVVLEPEEQESTFEIGRKAKRAIQDRPSTSGSIHIRELTNSEPSVGTIIPDQQLDQEDSDLENRLRALLGGSY